MYRLKIATKIRKKECKQEEGASNAEQLIATLIQHTFVCSEGIESEKT